LPGASKAVLSGLSNTSKLAIAAYIIGMAATGLTVVAELFTFVFKWGAAPALVCSLVSQLHML
jgi:pyruvate/2-oxoglutarate/acetoin dehydrogenase E1 component